MRSVRSWSLLLLALAAACERPVAPVLVEGARRFDPPAVYQLWWRMTLDCSARSTPRSAIRWYLVPGARSVQVNGQQYAGYWSSAGNSIVLAGEAVLNGALVRHEMLHALIEAGDHPRGEFLQRCGGVVECDDRCIADAGPLPPLDAAVTAIGPDALEIDVGVTPDAPSRALYGGHFAMTVTARNPRSDAVVVTLPSSTDARPPLSFAYRIEHVGGGFFESSDRAWDDGVTRFAPGETKRRVFDFHMVGVDESTLDGGLRPGTYDLRGAFASQWAPATTITLSPP